MRINRMTGKGGIPDPVYILRSSEAPITSLTFAGLGSGTLYSGGQDGKVMVWDMKIKRPISVIDAHPGRSVLWISSLDTEKMVTQGRNGQVTFWSAKGPDWLQTGSIHCSEHGFCPCTVLSSVAASPTSVMAVPSNKSSQVEIFDTQSQKYIGILKPETSKNLGMLMTLRPTDNSDEVIAGYEDGSIALWDIRTFKMVDRMSCYSESVMCLDYCGSLSKGMSGSVNDTLFSWQLSQERKFVLDKNIQTTNPGFNHIRIRNDGKIVAVAGWDGNIRVFGMKKLKPLALLSFHKESVQTLAFSEDNLLVCGSKDCHISLWDLYR